MLRLIHAGSASGLEVEKVSEIDNDITVRVLTEKGCWKVGDLVDVYTHQLEEVEDGSPT